MPADTPVSANRIERTLAFMVAGIVGISLLCIIAVLIGSAAGAIDGSGAWPVVLVLPGIGLPIGFVLLVVLLILSALRRRRESADAGR